ncbi:MAG: quinone oxidoreductase [Rhodocyclaceae bacterium]|nr:quinone oxidoreductase [Rhodocyclaceae bacterium]
MPHAIRLHRPGGPEVLKWEEVAVGDPCPNEARVRHHAVGLNFIDIYHRTGAYPLPLPSGIGLEGAGVVEAVGSEVKDLKAGDRVLSFEQGAAMMLQGMTAQYLLRRTCRVQPGDTILIHAAAGGVGLIVCQWAKALGAKVIGTVGSDEKAALARAHGCDHPIVYTREKFAERVKELTVGEGVAAVYDSIGKDTFMDSLACLRPLGMMALFGAASGPVPPFDLGLLAKMGSLFVTRPTLFTYTAKRADLVAIAGELFEAVTSGKVKIEVNQRYALKDAAKAQADLEARKTTGSTILLP